MTSTEYPDSASRVAISLKAGRKPKISGQTSTAGCLPLAGCTTYASQVPSGVLISTSAPFVSVALAIRGNAAVKPAASAIAPNRRRDTSAVRRENSSKSSNSHMRSVLLRNHNIRGDAETFSILAVSRDHGFQGHCVCSRSGDADSISHIEHPMSPRSANRREQSQQRLRGESDPARLKVDPSTRHDEISGGFPCGLSCYYKKAPRFVHLVHRTWAIIKTAYR